MSGKSITENASMLLARILTSIIFLTSSIAKMFGWQGNLEFIASRHPLPFPSFMLFMALVIELCGGLLLVAGFKTKIAAWIMFLYMIPVTLLFHDFGSTQFQKNFGIMGALLMLAVCGAGSWSLEERHSGTAGVRPSTALRAE